MQAFTQVMKALSDPTRVKILKLLQARHMCVRELQAALGVAQSVVSKHLKNLEISGLVQRRKEGLWVNYSLADGSRSPYAANLLGNLRHWMDDDPAIREVRDRSRHLRREDLCRIRD